MKVHVIYNGLVFILTELVNLDNIVLKVHEVKIYVNKISYTLKLFYTYIFKDIIDFHALCKVILNGQ